MATQDGNNDAHSDQANMPEHASTGKKSYQKPRVLYREPLEAMAALCTPAPPAKASPGMCAAGPINS